MTKINSSLMTLQEIDEVITITKKKFKLEKSGITRRFLESTESSEEGFFEEITNKISDGLRKVKLYGKEKIDEVVNSVKSTLSQAQAVLQDKFEKLLVQIEQFISTLFTEFMRKSLDLVPKKIQQGDQGYFKLDSVTFSRSISLESGAAASLTKFFQITASGEMSFDAEYSWNAN